MHNRLAAANSVVLSRAAYCSVNTKAAWPSPTFS